LDEEKSITKAEFEHEWDLYLVEWKTYWLKVQQAHPIGQKLQAPIWVNYPWCKLVELKTQGVGFIPNEKILKLADQPLNGQYPGKKVEVLVIGFDHVNMWVELEPLRFV